MYKIQSLGVCFL